MVTWSKIKERIYYEFLSLVKPEMIGVKNGAGKNVLKDTRVSNFSRISNPSNVFLGDNVFIAHFTYIDGFHRSIKIGNGCQISNFTSILTHSTHHAIRLYGEALPLYWQTSMKGLITGPVEIGEYTFVGSHVVIMPGTIIGKGCIVAAYSFLDGKYEDYSIVKGNPAKVIGDTREIDDWLLREFPELNEFYYLNIKE